MKEGKEVYILFLGFSLIFKCGAVEFPMPPGHEFKTEGGYLFIEAGTPSRYILYPTEIPWMKHSWLEHNKPRPRDVETIPLTPYYKQLILKEINDRRAKTLLGAYFDPSKAREFGYAPPAAQMWKVEFNEDIAKSTERYIQHFVFGHYLYNSFHPHVPLGENLIRTSQTRSLTRDEVKKKKTYEELIQKEFNTTDKIVTAFDAFFDKELPFYKHYDPYRRVPLQAMIDKKFREPIKKMGLSGSEKEEKLKYVQYGHYTAMIVDSVHSVGCALTRRGHVKNDLRYGPVLDYAHYFACNFGGGITTDGSPLYEMDENFLEQHNISKSQFNHES